MHDTDLAPDAEGVRLEATSVTADVLANDTHGVVLATFHAERDGQTVALRVADIWHLADGKATEHWSIFDDQAAADKLFS